MAKLATDLSTAAGLTDPSQFTDLKSSGQVPDDFEIDGVAGVVDNTGKSAYEPGQTALLEVTFTGARAGFSSLSGTQSNYTFSLPSELSVIDDTILPSFEVEVSSSASDGTYTVGVTYDEPFNAGETDVGTQQTIDITVAGYSVSLSARPASQTSIDLTLDITAGDPSYSVVIDRGTAPGSYPTNVVNTTESSAGTKTYTDSGLSSGTQYYYKATVTENGGDTDSSTANASTL